MHDRRAQDVFQHVENAAAIIEASSDDDHDAPRRKTLGFLGDRFFEPGPEDYALWRRRLVMGGHSHLLAERVNCLVPGSGWSGLILNLSGCEVHSLQINSYSLRVKFTGVDEGTEVARNRPWSRRRRKTSDYPGVRIPRHRERRFQTIVSAQSTRS